MFVIYKTATGIIDYVFNGRLIDLPDLVSGTDKIETVDQSLGDLAAWRVISNVLTYYDIQPARDKGIWDVNTIAFESLSSFIPDFENWRTLKLFEFREADAYALESPAPSVLTAYPLLEAEVNATGDTAANILLAWATNDDLIATHAAFVRQGQIEANAIIAIATTPAAIQTAVQNYLFTLTD